MVSNFKRRVLEEEKEELEELSGHAREKVKGWHTRSSHAETFFQSYLW